MPHAAPDPGLGIRGVDVVVVVPIGRIAHYPQGFFEATCAVRPRCRLQRTSKPKVRGRVAAGRPLGLVVAWLESSTRFATQQEHISVFAIATLSHPVREAARHRLAAYVIAGPLFAVERPRREGECEELDALP